MTQYQVDYDGPIEEEDEFHNRFHNKVHHGKHSKYNYNTSEEGVLYGNVRSTIPLEEGEDGPSVIAQHGQGFRGKITTRRMAWDEERDAEVVREANKDYPNPLDDPSFLYE